MSVYIGESAIFLEESLYSIWDSQVLRPNEIVLVCDGPLNDELNEIIQYWKIRLKDYFILLELPKREGLANALNIGLEYCNFDYVARMDSDDIAHSLRFYKQVHFLENNPTYSIVGGYVMEFNYSIYDLNLVREVPLDDSSIKRYLKLRCPFNHMSIFLKKKDILSVGGYDTTFGVYEDYFLWYKLYSAGFSFHNLGEVLVYARISNGMISKRKGYRALKNELKLQFYFYNQGFLNLFEFTRNIFFRLFPRLLPVFLLRRFYKFFLRK